MIARHPFRKFRSPWRTKSRSGAALLLALMVVFAASFVLAGWAMILASRSVTSEDAALGQKRRISYQNAKNIGLQWARRGLGANAITNVTVSLTNNWGQFSAATVASNILNTSLVDSRINHFSPMPNVFTLPVSTTLVGGGVTNSNTFFFRSRSPLYGGYPLVAQTNTLGFTTNFSRVSVATNGGGMALMYAQPGTLAVAPAATTYNSSTNRNVANALGSAFPAPISAYPFTPLVSTPSGNTAYNGLLAGAPPRTFTIDALRTAINTAYGTNALPVTDYGPYRMLGTLQDFKSVNVLSGTSGTIRHFILINTIPSSTLRYNGAGNAFGEPANTYTFILSTGQEFLISIEGGWLRFNRKSNNSNLSLSSATQYLRIESRGNSPYRDPSLINKPTGTNNVGISMIDSGNQGTSRLIGMEITNTELVALQDKSLLSDGGKYVIFAPDLGRSRAQTEDRTVEGAVIYNRLAYGDSSGIFFLLMNGPMTTTTYDALGSIRPTDSFRVRARVNGMSVVQINSGATPSFRYPFVDNNGVFAIRVEPTNSAKLRFLSTTNQTPLLVHVEQDEFPADSSLQWRKVLMVFDSENTLDVQAIGSSLTFSYFDAGDFDVGIDSGSDNTRPFVLSIAGRSSVNNTSTRFVGGGTRTWNMALTLRDSPATFELSANEALRLIGGIRSNSRVEATPSSASLILERNTNPGALELFSDRMGWVETWQQ